MRSMYVVQVRDRGLFLVEPLPGEPPAEAVVRSLGLTGGYSIGLMQFELPDSADQAWVALVEGTGPSGAPYMDYRVYPPDLSEEQVTQAMAAAGESPVKLNRSRIYREGDRHDAPEPEGPPIEWKG